MRRHLIPLFLLISLYSAPGFASMFGEENILLGKILATAIEQYYQLRSILQTGQDSFNLLQDINRGINDSMGLLKTTGLYTDPGLYSELQKVQDVMQKFGVVYGDVFPSPESTVQQNTDQVVAEAVTMNNSIFDYTKQIDEIGEQVKQFSHSVSPGGAQKLSAQTLGVMLHVMNQSLRAQATGLKVQAQAMAVENRKEKEMTRHIITTSESLASAMKSDPVKFDLPRF